MGDKSEKKKKEVRKKLHGIQEIYNPKRDEVISEYDIDIIEHLINFMVSKDKKSAEYVIGYLNDRMPSDNDIDDSKNRENKVNDRMPSGSDIDDENRKNKIIEINKKKKSKSEKGAYDALEKLNPANNYSVSKTESVPEIGYEIFRISEPDDFEYPENDIDDAKKYCDKFAVGIKSLKSYLNPKKTESTFATVYRKLVDCECEFNSEYVEKIYDGMKNISENTVKLCFRYMKETVFDSIIPILYSHIYDCNESNRDMYIEFLEELNVFIESMGIFTCNEFTDSGKSLVGENIAYLDDDQRMFYIITPLTSGEPEKDGIITEVEQLPYVTYYTDENDSLKRIVLKGKIMVIKSV